MLTHLGTFDVTSGALIVSDPCRSDPSLQIHLESARAGAWAAYVRSFHLGKCGTRNAELLIHHGDVDADTGQWKSARFKVGVDSGQAGFWDSAAYRGGSDNFYDDACVAARSSERRAATMNGGALSTAGFGDGVYECMYMMNGDEIVAAKIVFIDAEEIETTIAIATSLEDPVADDYDS